MGPTALLPPPKEDVLKIFSAPKNPTASAGFEPANLGTKGQHATSRLLKPLVIFMAAILQNTCLGSKYISLYKNKCIFYISAIRRFPIEEVSFHLSLENSLVQKTLHV
jgi:hypothetical protein